MIKEVLYFVAYSFFVGGVGYFIYLTHNHVTFFYEVLTNLHKKITILEVNQQFLMKEWKEREGKKENLK